MTLYIKRDGTRWYAVTDPDAGMFDALWLRSNTQTVETMHGPVQTDGMIRFCFSKRDLLTSIALSLGKTPYTVKRA